MPLSLEKLCLRNLGLHILDLFNCACNQPTTNVDRKKVLTTIMERLKTIVQSIPPLMANDFTNAVLKILTGNVSFIFRECQFDVHNKFLSLVLHPSVTVLSLPVMPADCNNYVYTELFGETLTKVEELHLVHFCSSIFEGLAKLPHLHTIIFHASCTDDFLENLWQCCGQKLRKLDILNSGSVTPKSIMALHKFQCLEELNIKRTDITGDSFQRLAYGLAGGTLPPTLRTIHCGSITVSDLNVLTTGNFPNLREIFVQYLTPNEPIDVHIGCLQKLELSFSSFRNDLLSLVGETLTELYLIRVLNLDARILMQQCPNLTRLEVMMCRQVTTVSEDIPLKGLNLLTRLHLDTYYLLADAIFLQYGKCISHLTIIDRKMEEVDAFLKLLTEVPRNLISIYFISFSCKGLLSTDAINKLIQLCPYLEEIKGVACRADISMLQKMNPSIKFIP